MHMVLLNKTVKDGFLFVLLIFFVSSKWIAEKPQKSLFTTFSGLWRKSSTRFIY